MNDAEERFAERLIEELDRVTGPGSVIGDVELSRPRGPDGPVHVHAQFVFDETWTTIDLDADDLVALYRPLIEKAVQARLASSLSRLVEMA
jgi:hypothetical protein